MIGHTPLLKMRRDGVLPYDVVHVIDGDSEFAIELAQQWHRIPSSANGLLTPHVVVGQEDSPERLDVRFCRQLGVVLEAGRGQERAQRLFKAIRAVEPAILCCAMPDEIWFYTKEQGGNGKRIHA